MQAARPFWVRHKQTVLSLENRPLRVYCYSMKLSSQNPGFGQSTIKLRTIFVLSLFCALLFLQTACTAGILSHCQHQDSHAQDMDHCEMDHCGDSYPLPVMAGIQKVFSQSPQLLPAAVDFALANDAALCAPYCQPIVINSPRPAGIFPLLI